MKPTEAIERDLYETAVLGARLNFEKDGRCDPIAIIATADTIAICPVAMGDDTEKDLSAVLLRAIGKLPTVQAIALISEVWRAPMQECRNGRASNAPSKRESVLIVIETPDRHLAWFADIARPPHLAPVLGAFEPLLPPGESFKTSGRFTGFFRGVQ